MVEIMFPCTLIGYFRVFFQLISLSDGDAMSRQKDIFKIGFTQFLKGSGIHFKLEKISWRSNMIVPNQQIGKLGWKQTL